VKVKGIAVQGVLGLRPVQAVYAFQVEEVPKPRNPYL